MFIIPMAGLSSRFFKAGFKRPKYQLPLGDDTVFSWSVKSFSNYFSTDYFIFIYRDIFDTKDFLLYEINKIGIMNYNLVALSEETEGQADTVYRGMREIVNDDSLYIFNIDSKIIDFVKPEFANECDGYLEVFEGDGENWSFVLPGTNHMVIRTTAKYRISNLCSDGLYYFRNKYIFEQLFLNAKQNGNKSRNEYYIAPLYNDLIQSGGKVLYNMIESNKILFCGTPDEYYKVLNSYR